MEDEHEASSLRHRRRKSWMNISCCLHSRGHHHHSFNPDSSSFPSPNSFRLPSPNSLLRRPSPSSWFRSKSRSHLLSRSNRHRRHSSADLGYDAHSYALNFEDHEDGEPDETPLRNFAARLPASPPRTRKLEELAAKMEALELRRKGELQVVVSPSTKPTETDAGELRGNVFEVRTTREKADPARLPLSPLSPSQESQSRVGVSRTAREILVEIC